MPPLLRTKLFVPPVRPDLVSRPRLVDRLNAGLPRKGVAFGCKVTLISAPAGFGKTTLLSEWVHQSQAPVAWLSLDENDNDPARFLAYVIAALQTIPGLSEAELGHSALASAESLQPQAIESVLTALINDLIEVSSTDAHRPFVLVLDDYHMIESQAIDRALGFLLDHMPSLPRGLHVIIAGRADPSLSLSRLRAGGQMTEIRVDDLRFTHDEVSTFLTQTMGLHLSADSVAALEVRTEGWIVGLQLAALSLQGEHPDHIPRFIQTFTGSHRYVVDYLVEEVLRRRPQGTRAFLLKTSILDRLSGGLCDAVTGQSDGQATLERLEEANLFLVPLDDERVWYRYHHLFAELLRNQLAASQPDLLPTLHRSASAWFETEGLLAEAITHSIAAQDWELAARETLAMVSAPDLPPDPLFLELFELMTRYFRSEKIVPLLRDVELEGLIAPTYLLMGQYESTMNPYKAIKRGLKLLPNVVAAEIVPGVGHSMIHRQSDWVTARVTSFLDRYAA